MTWTNITGTTTISASRAVTLPVRFRSEPIKILALHPGSGIGGTLTIWDENGRSVQVTRLDPNQSRYEAEFYSDVDGFNYSFAADGNGVVASPGISVYLVSRPAADPDIVNGTIVMSGPVQAPNLRKQKSSGTWTPSPNPRFLSAGSAGTTAQIIAKAPHKFSRLKVAFGSVNNGAAYSVNNCALGVTKTPDVMTPSTGGTVTGDGTTGLVLAISSPLAVAQNASAFVSRVWTPWVPMPAIQADDGFYYWLCRYDFSGLGAAYGQGVAADGWRRDDTGNWWAMKRVTTGANAFFGDDAAAFGPAADATAYQAFAHVVQADFGGCGEGQISVGAFGASTMTRGTDNTGSYIERTNGVCFERKNGISIVGMAQPNTTTAQIYDDIIARGLNTEFDVILMPVFSSNDGFTEGLVLKQLMRAFTIRDMAARYGQKVLFVILPHNGAAATPELLAIRQGAEAQLFAAGGVIDLCPLIGGASRYLWDATWSDDGIHPNAAGQDRLKLLAPDVIVSAVRGIVQ